MRTDQSRGQGTRAARGRCQEHQQRRADPDRILGLSAPDSAHTDDGFDRALRRLEGVKTIDTDVEVKRVTVEHDKRVGLACPGRLLQQRHGRLARGRVIVAQSPLLKLLMQDFPLRRERH